MQQKAVRHMEKAAATIKSGGDDGDGYTTMPQQAVNG
jgi:hypothetical protein